MAVARQMIQTWPNHGFGWKVLGTVLAADGRLLEAVPVLEKSLALSPSDPETHSNLGKVLQDLGRSAEAATRCRQALSLKPEFHGAHHNLGNALTSLGRAPEAEESLRRALALAPDYSEVHSDLGCLLQSVGRLPEAESCFRRMLALKPGDHAVRQHLGNALKEIGRLDEADANFRLALALNPDCHETHNDLGVVLQELGRSSEAEACYRRALQLRPELHQTHNNLATILRERGRVDEAMASVRRAIELEPGYDDAYYNLGTMLHEHVQSSEAVASLRRAIELEPDYHEAHYNLGNAFQARGLLSSAEASFRRALVLKPDLLEAHNNLGNVLESLGRSPDAEASLRRALALRPDLPEAPNNLGNALQTLGRLSESVASFRRALELKPDYHDAQSNLGNAFKALGRPAKAQVCYRRALELKPDYAMVHSNVIFTLDLLEECSIQEQQAERRRWYERHGRKHVGAIRPHDNPRDPERKLRIGYVSADFRNHSAYHGFSPIILRHDRNAFEVVCYSGVKLEDDATARLRRAAHEWRSTLGVSDDALAEQIRHERIDILVDLSGHSAGNRLPVFARKPAPIQVTGWGFAGGTGLPTVDYYASDVVVVPEAERALYAEEVIYLPCGACYEAPEYAPAVSKLPALQGKAFTFGCLNRVEKISDRVIGLWGRILARLPDAQLLIKGGGLTDPELRQTLLRRLGNAGIVAERVNLMGISAHPEHLRIYHDVDLGLDPYPHGGGISTAEALWMGVPVVALGGKNIASRITPSMLTALRMTEWIARSDEDYVRIALQAARDLPGLARVRAELRSRLAGSGVGDVQRYTRTVETAFRTMWRRWCATSGPAPGSGPLRCSECRLLLDSLYRRNFLPAYANDFVAGKNNGRHSVFPFLLADLLGVVIEDVVLDALCILDGFPLFRVRHRPARGGKGLVSHYLRNLRAGHTRFNLCKIGAVHVAIQPVAGACGNQGGKKQGQCQSFHIVISRTSNLMWVHRARQILGS